MLATVFTGIAVLAVAPQDPVAGTIAAADVEWAGWYGKAADGRAFGLRAHGFLSWPGLGGPSKELDEGAVRFVRGWLAKHAAARVLPVYEFEGLQLTWSIVRDGDAVLNVELVRAGLGSASQLVGDAVQLASFPAGDRQALIAAAQRAELEALEDKAGQWGLPGAEGSRQFRLGEHRFEKAEDQVWHPTRSQTPTP